MTASPEVSIGFYEAWKGGRDLQIASTATPQASSHVAPPQTKREQRGNSQEGGSSAPHRPTSLGDPTTQNTTPVKIFFVFQFQYRRDTNFASRRESSLPKAPLSLLYRIVTTPNVLVSASNLFS